MKIFVNLVLYLLLVATLMMFFAMFVDISIAHNDYQRLSERGDYEKKVEGCIFDWVCEKYTRELQK